MKSPKLSIRQKIILPSIILFSLMALSSMILSLTFLTQFLGPQIASQEVSFRIVISIIIAFAILVAAMMVVYAIIVRNITSSIDILTTVAEKVSEGDLDQKVFIENDDEMGRLSDVFNHMIKSLRESTTNLNREKNQSEAIFSCLPEAIILTDKDNRLIVANAQAEIMLKFSKDKVQGKEVLDYITNSDLTSALTETLEKGQGSMRREVVFPDKEGQQHIYELTSSIAKDDKDDIIGVITILRDITHDKELEELREGFLRTVSHELRTPLTTIIGFVELLQKGTGGGLSDKQGECLTIVSNEATNLKNLIEDLLDLSRIRAGHIHLDFTSFNIHDLIQSVCDSFQPIATGKKIDLIHQGQKESKLLVADKGKLRRILINLISNAIKFTNEGSVTIYCNETKDSVGIYVKDTGIGLLEEEQEVVFEKFRQVDYSSTRRYEGIGLGLSIVQQLVDMHQGEIYLESSYGKGSTFGVVFPKKN